MKLKKNLSSPLAWCLSSIVLGLLLVILNEDILRWVFYLLGLSLFVTGLIPIVTALGRKQDLPVMPFLYLIGGVLIVLMNNSLSAILFVLMGVLLMLTGIQNINSFINIRRGVGIRIPFVSYLIPAFCVLAGAVAIANPFVAQKTLIVFIGICILVEGIFNLLSLTALFHSHKTEMKQFFGKNRADKSQAEDAVIVTDEAETPEV